MTGVSMKERAAIGTHWRRKRDRTVWLLVQSHRKDRLAELVAVAPQPLVEVRQAQKREKLWVPFHLLRTRYEEVQR